MPPPERRQSQSASGRASSSSDVRRATDLLVNVLPADYVIMVVMANSRPRRNQRGFSLIELLIVVAIILILAAIAAPKLNQNRMHAQETAAIREMQTIHTAETQYYSQFGRYATALPELGPPAGGQEGASGANLIPGELAKGLH